MALVHSSQHETKLRLSQSITKFEESLSTEQKNVLLSYRHQSRNSPPSPSDVMRLTAEIDFQTSTKVRGRCFGPRLTNVLQTIQQFAALGDVIIGGSQNIIACSVWSLVRMSLLSTITFVPYFDQLSALLMAIGRSSPRYQEMALLYQGSKKLQSYLCEYLIVVVDFCHYIYTFTQKSAIGQYISSHIDLGIGKFKSDLDSWGDVIEKEVYFQMAKTINDESQSNSKFKAYLTKNFDLRESQRKKRCHLRLLDLFSKYDHESTWKQTRKAGKTTLLKDDVDYTRWKSQDEATTIIYTGKLGSGKSVLLANIVDDLHLSTLNKIAPVTFFFCRHDISESLKATTVIGSLARQLLRTVLDLEDGTELLDSSHTTIDLEDVSNLLHRVLPSDFKAYFVLDGLDECDFTERTVLINQLRSLQKLRHLSICVSVRPEPNDALKLSLREFADPKVLSIPENNPDIAAFIEAELEASLEAGRLVLGDPKLILDIVNSLLKGSQGMFLWVALQMESLCEMQTDETIRQALNDLPRDLPETFSRILRRSTAKFNYQRRVLQLVIAAFRPLTTEEIREALSVVNGNTVWDRSRLLNDIHSVLSSCGSLLVIEEEDHTIRLVHHSAKQFLLKRHKDTISTALTQDEANKELAEIVTTYLNYNVFETQVSGIVLPHLTAASAMSAIISSTLESKSVRNYALGLLKTRAHLEHNISKTLAEQKRDIVRIMEEEYHFYHYAKSYWLQHILRISKPEMAMLKLVSVLLRMEAAAEPSMIDDQGQTLLLWAIEKGYDEGVKLLLDTGKIDIDTKHNNGRTLLSWAVRDGQQGINKLLLKMGNRNMDIRNREECQTPLIIAAKAGNDAVVKLLLETNKIDVDMRDENGQTPLLWAALKGNTAVVNLLLKTGKVRVNDQNKEGQTPLILAAKSGHDAVVKLLLKTGRTNVNYSDFHDQTPLSWAAENGCHAVVKLLLETDGVQINVRNRYGQTPLSWAAINGHEGVVKLLLETGKADIDVRNDKGQTPLSLAAGHGYEAIVELLLRTGKVNIYNIDMYGQTPSSWAAINSHETVVSLLSRTGA